MDNVSHSLAGWALSRAAGPVRPAGTTLALVLASNLPDIDIVLEARSDAAYLLFHRGLTHSFLGLAAFPLLLAAGLWWAYGGRTPLRWFCLLSYCGVALHLLYDVVTPWGTMLLYPFSPERYALDWLFIVDFVTWSLPLAALLVARLRPRRGRAAVVGWLAVTCVYAAGAAALHGDAVRATVAAEARAGRPVAEAFAFPRLGAPLRWNGVAVAPAGLPEPRITLYRVSGVPPDPALVDRLERGFDDPWVAAALASPAGQAYLWWARVPVATTAHDGDTVTVTLRDLRYSRTIVPTVEAWTPFDIRFRFDARAGRLNEVTW